VADINAVVSGLCGDLDRLKCEAEFGENIGWVCSNCNKKAPKDLSRYTLKLFYIRGLMKAGYPLSANDLSLEEWEDLARIEEALHGQQQ
jgi:hypothetical protein